MATMDTLENMERNDQSDLLATSRQQFIFWASAGTTLNYFLDDRINRAEILFPGVGCFLIAAFLGSFLHSSNVADIDKKLGIQRGGNKAER